MANNYESKNVVLEKVVILPGAWRNFSGIEGTYNPAGKRNFNIQLTDDQFDRLNSLGYNVKITKPNPNDPDAEPTKYIKVNVKFNSYGPKIHVYTTTSDECTEFGEDQISLLDDATIVEADVVIRPYEWKVQGNSGITPYLNELFVRILANPIRDRYEAGE